MTKVYCKNCRHFYCIATSWTSTRQWKDLYCDPFNKVIRGTFNDEYNLMELENPKKINVNNDCPHYKRKWWKFWVRDRR